MWQRRVVMHVGNHHCRLWWALDVLTFVLEGFLEATWLSMQRYSCITVFFSFNYGFLKKWNCIGHIKKITATKFLWGLRFECDTVERQNIKLPMWMSFLAIKGCIILWASIVGLELWASFQTCLDTTDVGFRGVLLHEDEKSVDHPMPYFSKKLN